jgi:hypothetical protein
MTKQVALEHKKIGLIFAAHHTKMNSSITTTTTTTNDETESQALMTY